jgi:hypothetical protein
MGSSTFKKIKNFRILKKNDCFLLKYIYFIFQYLVFKRFIKTYNGVEKKFDEIHKPNND